MRTALLASCVAFCALMPAHGAGGIDADAVPQAQATGAAVLRTRAFEAACKELGIGEGSMDVWRKERIARLLEAFAHTKGLDSAGLARKAVDAFLSEASGSETSSQGT